MAKLEDDKSALESALAKTRRSLTQERNGNAAMSKLRYDLELARAEVRDLKRANGTVGRQLKNVRQELTDATKTATRLGAELSTKDRISGRHFRAR